MRSHHVIPARRRQDRESGQATVEFALILIPLLIIVVGIVQFGIGLNYWLDMNRLANQGARWAVVNNWPNCPLSPPTPACTGTTPGAAGNSLTTYIRAQAATQGLTDAVSVSVCYPDDGDALTSPGDVGTPVRVNLDAPYTFRLIMKLPSIDLHARTTMRLEQSPTHLVASGC